MKLINVIIRSKEKTMRATNISCLTDLGLYFS